MEDNREYSDTPERRLWKKVVIAAIVDASSLRMKYVNTSHHNRENVWSGEMKNMKYQVDHEWFATICWMADVNYWKSRETVHKILDGKIAYENLARLRAYY
jgi:hypothetical protein